MSMDLYIKCIISKNIIGHHLTVLQLTVVFQFYPVHPSTPMRDQDRISPHNISEIPAKKPRTQPNKRMSSKDNTGKGNLLIEFSIII